MPKTVTLYLIRHGESEHNVLRVTNALPRKEVYGLTAHGREEVAAAAARLTDEHITRVYHSPMRRARETAVAIAAACAVPCIEDMRLTEDSMGQWEGRSILEFLAHFPHRRTRQGDGIETYPEVVARLTDFLHDLAPTVRDGEHIAIVSHAGPLRTLREVVAGADEGTIGVWHPAQASCRQVTWTTA